MTYGWLLLLCCPLHHPTLSSAFQWDLNDHSGSCWKNTVCHIRFRWSRCVHWIQVATLFFTWCPDDQRRRWMESSILNKHWTVRTNSHVLWTIKFLCHIPSHDESPLPWPGHERKSCHLPWRHPYVFQEYKQTLPSHSQSSSNTSGKYIIIKTRKMWVQDNWDQIPMDDHWKWTGQNGSKKGRSNSPPRIKRNYNNS